MWSILQMVADVLLCFFAAVLVGVRGFGLSLEPGTEHLAPPLALLVATGFALLMALLYSFAGLYRQEAARASLPMLLGRALLAVGAGSFIAYCTLKTMGDGRYALLFLLYAVPVMALGLPAVRAAAFFGRRSGLGAKRVLIVGTGPEARGVAAELQSNSGLSYVLVGFCPVKGTDQGVHALNDVAAPIFSADTPIDELALAHRVDEIIVAVQEQRGVGLPMDQLLASRIRGIPVIDLAAFSERTSGEVPTKSLKASWLIYGHGFVQGGLRTAVKRDFDRAVSLLLLILAAPIMVVTAIAIKLESRGPILYLQERVGFRGRTFMCPKFRSMAVDAEKDGVARWATSNDARVTRVGAVIRSLRIDELPQLVSVLRGEMSLVGPRPERPAFVRQLQAEIPFYDIRHSVKPGVTGWAQVRYRYGASVEDAYRKHQFDLYYVKNHTLFLDLLVLVRTVSVVLFREGSR